MNDKVSALRDALKLALKRFELDGWPLNPDNTAAIHLIRQVLHDTDGGVATDSASLEEDIRSCINRHCAENGSDTPDYVLAEFLMDCLAAFDAAVVKRRRSFSVGERYLYGDKL